ncbi:MAG TPA: protease modulator HflC, partial [Verrucomicrobiae bacterium]|nr:protease modulator HflC [Verrucomicrobiae bacterium]
IFLVLIVGLLLFVFQVRKSEVVVITRFGKPVRDLNQPGPHLKWPWPIEKVNRFDQRVQNFEDKLTEGLTMDSFNVLASVFVGWEITDPQAFYPTFASASSEPIAEAEKMMDRMLSNAKLAVIGKHPLSDFLSSDAETNKFADIEKEILTVVQNQVNQYKYGLKIDFLGIKRLGLPQNVTASVFERMQAERKRLADKSQYQGEADAQTIRAEADRKAAVVLADAAAEATAIRGKGEAEAAKSLETFQANPELANFIFSLTALEDSLKERSTLILDQHTPPFDLFNGVTTNLLKSAR